MIRKTPSLLIVEDDPIIAMSLEDEALRMGWRVVGPAYSLEEGLQAARDSEVDFALLDYNLKDGTNSVPIAEMLSSREVDYCFVTAADRAEVQAINPRVAVAAKPLAQAVLRVLLDGASRRTTTSR